MARVTKKFYCPKELEAMTSIELFPNRINGITMIMEDSDMQDMTESKRLVTSLDVEEAEEFCKELTRLIKEVKSKKGLV